MTSEYPERRFWQIHLSTAILLMFAAGGLLWLNTIPNSHIVFELPFELRSPLKDGLVWGDEYWEYGWPLSSYANVKGVWRLDRMALNFSICFVLLLILAICFEWAICRREAERHA